MSEDMDVRRKKTTKEEGERKIYTISQSILMTYLISYDHISERPCSKIISSAPRVISSRSICSRILLGCDDGSWVWIGGRWRRSSAGMPSLHLFSVTDPVTNVNGTYYL